MDYYCKIAHVVDSLKNGKKSGKKASLLIGAGCSVTANVPTAAGFVEEIKTRFKDCYRRVEDKTYPKCMAELAPGQRKTLIQEFVDNAKINWTHICIAQLMKEGYVDRVLTTNFDLLVVRACALLGEFPSVYDFASSQILKPAEITDNAVFYLHGQYTGFVLMNTDEEVKRHSKLLAPVFEDAQRGRTWIVNGYSGENDPVFDHLSKVKCFDDNLYWVGYGKNSPSKHVREQLLQENKYAYFIDDYDSDRFFITLAQELNCFPPKIFSKPFTHLQDIFKSFTPFPVLDSDLGNKNSFDFTGKTKRMISSAVKTLEKGEAPKRKTITQLQKNVKKAEELYIKGSYKEVIKMEKQIKKDKKAKNLIYWSYISLGNEGIEKSEALTGKVSERLLLTAIKYYSKARATKRSSHEALINWGIALTNLANIKEKPLEKEKLFKEAISKYESALKIKTDNHEALYNWGITLDDFARIKEKPLEKQKLFKEAISKYESALKIKPDNHEALYNWGIALTNLARIKEKPLEKQKLFKEAISKYESALKIKPDNHEALYNWGIALTNLARIKEKPLEKQKLFKEAISKYESALKIKPDNHEALYNLGGVLCEHVKTMRPSAKKEKIFLKGLIVLKKAEKIIAGSASYNIACAYSLLNNQAKCREFLNKSKKYSTLPSKNHLKQDSDLDNVRTERWYKEFIKKL